MGGIGILAGIFDPIHRGHILLAERAAARLSLSRVYLLPMQREDGRQAVASLKMRRRMAEAAVQDHPLLSVLSLPPKRDTLTAYEAVRLIAGQNKNIPIYFLIGASRLEDIRLDPHLNDLVKRCGFAVFKTPGYPADRMAACAAALNKTITVMDAVYPMTETVRRQIALLNDSTDLLPREVSCIIARNGLYMPHYEDKLKTMMTAQRFAHTVSVRETAVDLAYIHGAPLFKASVAGMLHDCAKCMPFKVMRDMAVQQGLTDSEEVLSSGALLHGVVGAALAESLFRVYDESVLSAIACHTMGKKDMSLLDLCVFVADTVEPLRRDFEGLSEIRSLSRTDLRLAAVRCLEATRRHVLAQGGHYGGQSAEALEDLLQKISNMKEGEECPKETTPSI